MVEKNKNGNTSPLTAGISLQSLIDAIHFQPNLQKAFYLSSIRTPHPYGKKIHTNPLFNKVKRKLEKELLNNNDIISFHLSWDQIFSEGHALAVYKEQSQIRFYDANIGETIFDTVGHFIAMLERHYNPADLDSRVPSGASFRLRRYYSKHTVKNALYHFFKYKALNPWYYLSPTPLAFLFLSTLLLGIFFLAPFATISLAVCGLWLVSYLMIEMGALPLMLHKWDSFKLHVQNYFNAFPSDARKDPQPKITEQHNPSKKPALLTIPASDLSSEISPSSSFILDTHNQSTKRNLSE